jgi:hypothetical protein
MHGNDQNKNDENQYTTAESHGEFYQNDNSAHRSDLVRVFRQTTSN